MKLRRGQVCTYFFTLLAVMAPFSAQAADSAEEILDAARINRLLQPAKFQGRLRTDGEKVPFLLVVNDKMVEYQFENPEQTVIMDFETDPPRLREKAKGKTSTVTEARYDQVIRDTAITYEDIAMRFLHWPNPVLKGEENVRMQKAWKLEISAPDKDSQYALVNVWINQQSGALMRMEGYDAEGKLRKRFEAVSIQKLGDRWMLKQMRIEGFDPVTQKVATRTYLEITGEWVKVNTQ